MREARRDPAAVPQARLGFFAHAKQGEDGYRGALLVVTPDGDPADFLYTDKVALGRVSRRLLGARAAGYVIERVLLPPLLAEAGPLQLLCFDDPLLLVRDVRLTVPCVLLAPPASPHRRAAWVAESRPDGDGSAANWWMRVSEAAVARDRLDQAAADVAPFSLKETFMQLRAAMADLG